MDLHDQFLNLTYPDIESYVAEGQEEHLHIDFKTVKGATLRSDDDKRNLAKALSGFANSSGGIVIWGVDARKGAGDIDRAQAIIEIDPVAQFVARLNELTGSFVEPIVNGVQHRSLVKSETMGVALTLVPESETGPHMAKGGEDRYYKRSGDSFYRMEHFDVADMFGRRRRPELYLVASMRSEGTLSGGGLGMRHVVRVVLSIINQGRGTARAPYLAFRLNDPYRLDSYGVDGNRNEGLNRLAVAGDGRLHAYGSLSSLVIHPEVQLDVCGFRIEVSKETIPPDVEISYSLAAEDMRIVKRTLVLPGQDIALRVADGLL